MAAAVAPASSPTPTSTGHTGLLRVLFTAAVVMRPAYGVTRVAPRSARGTQPNRVLRRRSAVRRSRGRQPPQPRLARGELLVGELFDGVHILEDPPQFGEECGAPVGQIGAGIQQSLVGCDLPGG